jgi:thiamine biosynthesis protein ThiI
MKLVSLISSGIDSPVATYLFIDKIQEIILLHTDNRPFTDDREIANFIGIAKHLRTKMKIKIKAYLVSNGKSLSSYIQQCNSRYICVFCKRMILRYAQEIAKKEKADAIIMGDSLGQVASQTLQNIRVIDNVVDMPVLRPVIGYDKEDIINVAKKIGTYKFSIKKSDKCSAVPNKPATRAKLDKILAEEKKLDIENLVKQAVDNAELIFI